MKNKKIPKEAPIAELDMDRISQFMAYIDAVKKRLGRTSLTNDEIMKCSNEYESAELARERAAMKPAERRRLQKQLDIWEMEAKERAAIKSDSGKEEPAERE